MKVLKSFLFAVVSLVAARVFMTSGELKTAGCQEMSFDDMTRAEFKEYRDWRRINRTPMVVRPNFIILDGIDNWDVSIATVSRDQKSRKKKPKAETQPAPPPPVSPSSHQSDSNETDGGVQFTRERKPPTYGVVFVNSPGFDFFLKTKSTKAFPVGTVIVRETRIEPDDETPRTVLAMIKRAKGFNPKGGDWEFIEADGLDLKLVKRQTTGSCLECHEQAGKTDFVFRTAATATYR